MTNSPAEEPHFRTGFAYRTEADPKNHVHFIASSTDYEDVVVMNFTTKRSFTSTTCVLRAGDHPSITHDTCVAYDLATIQSLSVIKRQLFVGTIVPETRLSTEVICKVFEGAEKSVHLSNECRALMSSQSLISETPPAYF